MKYDKLELGDLEVDIFRVMNLDRAFLIKIISAIKKDYFESNILSKIFVIYQTFFEKLNKLPSESIIRRELVKAGDSEDRVNPLLERIFNEKRTLEHSEIAYVKDEVETFAIRARMKEAVRQSMDFLEDDDFASITNVVKDALLFSMDIDKGIDLYDVDERYKRLSENLDEKLQTGYKQLDKVLQGGWVKKELYAFMGPPGIGKSIWLVNLGLKALLHGYNVLHYSMEMSEDRVGERYDSIATKIESKNLIGSSTEVKAKYNTYQKLTKSRLKIKEFPTAMASILDFEAHMEQLRLYDDFVPDIIMCDYGDIMRSTRQTHSSYEEQGWIFRELRGLAVKHNVAIITGTQARRDAIAGDGGTKDVVGMEQVADSMEKNRIIDGLFSITQSRAERDDGVMRLWVAKNRNGEANKDLEFRINYRLLELKDPPSINPLSSDDADTN